MSIFPLIRAFPFRVLSYNKPRVLLTPLWMGFRHGIHTQRNLLSFSDAALRRLGPNFLPSTYRLKLPANRYLLAYWQSILECVC